MHFSVYTVHYTRMQKKKGAVLLRPQYSTVPSWLLSATLARPLEVLEPCGNRSTTTTHHAGRVHGSMHSLTAGTSVGGGAAVVGGGRLLCAGLWRNSTVPRLKATDRPCHFTHVREIIRTPRARLACQLLLPPRTTGLFGWKPRVLL